MRKLMMLGAVASMVAIAQPGFAADIPVKAPVAVATVHNWTGAYLGIVAGWGSADSVHTNVNNGLNSDIHASAEYRAHLVTVMAKRAVQLALA